MSSQPKLLQRMDASGDSDPYYALFDGAHERQTPDWDAVPDRGEAVRLLARMFTWGRVHARFAALALAQAPVADLAAPMLRDLLPRLASSADHQRFAAYALISLVDGPEPNATPGLTAITRSSEPSSRNRAPGPRRRPQPCARPASQRSRRLRTARSAQAG